MWGRAPAKLLAALALFLLFSEVGLRFTLGPAKVPRDAPAAAYFAALGRYAHDAPLPSRALPSPGGFRIVVLGDSTAVGFPYSLVLDETGRPIDLQGFTVQGLSSAGMLADLDAALASRPDLLLVYVGHNELTWRLTRPSPFGRARHGVGDALFAGWHDLLRGLRDAAREREATRLRGMPAAFARELGPAARLLALGDPGARPPETLPLEPREIALHLDRYEANLRALVARVRAARVRLALIEPTSSLLAAPIASGRGRDPRAQRAWAEGMAARERDPRAARAFLVAARDLDPAPMRLTSAGLERLRRAAGDTPRVVLDDGGLEEGFIDPIHPSAALAAAFAERIAAALPSGDVPRLDPGDPVARGRFRAATRARLESGPAVSEAIARGDAAGRAFAAVLHLGYGNRAAAEAEMRAVPEAARDFRMVLLLDLALRWRGARDEANGLLARAASRRADWAPAVAWWRERADR